MSLDLGAIAKGYIADGVKRLLAEAGIARAMIDLGGNVVLHGSSPILRRSISVRPRANSISFRLVSIPNP
ncbi:FAD:protein FMN transferase [Eikenella sp. Marseille-P7795]|uniref:FAD:protein FMN transferase n=1 Tax=Eikenella sp. Marseille-P7795 TaxID=2866577 RepID=UPI001CE3E6B7